MKKSWWILMCGVLFFSCSGEKKDEKTPEKEVEIRVKYGFPIDDYRVVLDTVRNNETISDILSKYNVDFGVIHNLAQKSKEFFSVRNIRPNHQYSLLFCSQDSTAMPKYFIYEHNLAEYVVYELGDTIRVSLEKNPVEKRTETYQNTIHKSLWHSFTEHGKSSALAMELASVYQWAIDFYNIKEGDAYKVLYDQDFVRGKPLGNIKIIACEFTHQDSIYSAYFFQNKKEKGYFDENGASLHKAFLKAPLKFSHISSRFSGSRLHPVLKYRRAHRGVDYAAATGTPVRSVGNGTVIKKTYQRGGAGKYVKIRHNKTYTTVYMHFSRHKKGLQVGQRVAQGDIIGYVGMTGSATGPHLHYGVIKNGKYINPLSMKLPPSKPLKGEILQEFMQVRDSLKVELDKRGQVE
ncbi:MAG: peptidoglycan DD-metalloendopeptidase family protein [Flavobacteriaceae bacterium]|nr:peptidoglycan DD-metalloendopeptidase family protein [Flavobacteriaceae bacterium]